jgi:Beta-glucosidase-related glycosidases
MKQDVFYLDDTLSDEARAADLVSHMTLEEKVSQMLFQSPAIARLGVPSYNWWNEALHGVARAGVATVFPQAIGIAASFDTQLVEQTAETISTEGRAKYQEFQRKGDHDIYKGLTFWSPNVNIFRDPRWGRGHETYGEDPYLTAELGKAFVRGIQGNDPRYLRAAACAKHNAVHSGPENERHSFNAEVSGKDLRETYVYAFHELVAKAGVEGVMGAYNRVGS